MMAAPSMPSSPFSASGLPLTDPSSQSARSGCCSRRNLERFPGLCGNSGEHGQVDDGRRRGNPFEALPTSQCCWMERTVLCSQPHSNWANSDEVVVEDLDSIPSSDINNASGDCPSAVSRQNEEPIFQQEHPLGSFREEPAHGMELDRLDRQGVVYLLKRRIPLIDGKRIHAHVLSTGLQQDTFIGNLLMCMYRKNGALEDARCVFEKMLRRNVVSWNTMIAAYSQLGYAEEALQLFWQMRRDGTEANQITFISVLGACASPMFLSDGREIHALIRKSGFDSDVVLETALVNMYGKCGASEEAWAVFNEMSHRNVVSWNAMIAAYMQEGFKEDALEFFLEMQRQGIEPSLITFVSILGACSSPKNLAQGEAIHASIRASGFESDVIVETALVTMYGRCGALHEARSVFDNMHDRNVVSWTAMIVACFQNGEGKQALQLFLRMLKQGVKPNQITFLSMLGMCTSAAVLGEGKEIHESIVNSGFQSDVAVGNALINMYGKCGAVKLALSVFENMQQKNVVSWTSMIVAYCQQGLRKDAVKLFWEMQCQGAKPNQITFISVLGACTCREALADGKAVHASAVDNGVMSDMMVANAIVNMYGKCEALEEARSVFDQMQGRNVVSWNTIITAYSQHGEGREAMQLFQQMQQQRMEPNEATFIAVLGSSDSPTTLARGWVIHSTIVYAGFDSDIAVSTALVTMYGKCGDLEHGLAIFNKMPQRNLVSWNAMIAAYTQHGHGKDALKLFQKMLQHDVESNEITFITILGACENPGDLEDGKMLHQAIIDCGHEADVVVGTALVSMYGNCGNLKEARLVFDSMQQRNVVSWNAMIGSYACQGHTEEALQVFQQMQEQGVEPDQVSFIVTLRLCASPATLELGKAIHKCILDSEFKSSVVLGTALINMYGKCEAVEEARIVFEKLLNCNVTSWNAMIAVYVQQGNGKEALKLFQEMQQQGVVPTQITFITVLDACASPADLDVGKAIHTRIVDRGFESHVVLGTALVNMYSRCGALKHAQYAFDRMRQHDRVSWTAMISAFAHYGNGEKALRMLRKMQQERVEPDEVTFVSILSACSHAGLVDEGRLFFGSMTEEYGISPTLEHFTCIVDLLGRAGHLEEAESLIQKMPVQADAAVWMTLLGACQAHGDVQRAKRVGQNVVDLDLQNATTYVLLSNIYAR